MWPIVNHLNQCCPVNKIFMTFDELQEHFYRKNQAANCSNEALVRYEEVFG